MKLRLALVGVVAVIAVGIAIGRTTIRRRDQQRVADEQRRQARAELALMWQGVVAVREVMRDASLTPEVVRERLERPIATLEAFLKDHPDLADMTALVYRARAVVGAVAESGDNRPLDAIGLVAPPRIAGEIEDLPDQWPHYAPALRDRARARIANGDHRRAIDDLDQLVRLWPADFVEWGERAQARLAVNDLKGCIEDATRTIERDPARSGIWLIRGSARFALGEFAGARDDATHALQLDGVSRPILLLRGRAQLKLNDSAGAEKDGDQLLALRADDVESLIFSGHARLPRDPKAAAERFEGAMKADPKSAEAVCGRGIAKLALSDLDGALADLTKAIDLSAACDLALYHRACLRMQRDNPFGAIDDLTRAIRALQQGLPGVTGYIPLHELYRQRAIARTGADDPQGGVNDLAEALRIAPGNMDCLMTRADIRFKTQDYYGAFEDANQAIAGHPKAGPTYAVRAAVQEALADREPARRAELLRAAEADYAKALELLDPKSPIRGATTRFLDRVRAKLEQLPPK